MTAMPTVTQVNRTLGGRNVHAVIRDAHAEQRAADDAARRQRDAQPSGNETVSGSVECPLTGDTEAAVKSTRVSFGRIAFTVKPVCLCGSCMAGTEAVWAFARADDATWEMDASGLYRGVSIVSGYVGAPIYATSISVDYLFIGPALRLA